MLALSLKVTKICWNLLVSLQWWLTYFCGWNPYFSSLHCVVLPKNLWPSFKKLNWCAVSAVAALTLLIKCERNLDILSFFVAFLENLIFVALNLLITWKFKFQTHGNPELEQYSLEPVTQTRNLIQFIFNRSMMMFGHLNLINADKKDETKSEMSRMSWPEWTINVTTRLFR